MSEVKRIGQVSIGGLCHEAIGGFKQWLADHPEFDMPVAELSDQQKTFLADVGGDMADKIVASLNEKQAKSAINKYLSETLKEWLAGRDVD